MAKQQSSPSTSSSLLKLCIQNDAASWERLQKLYESLILYWIKAHSVPSNDRRDVLQNVMISVFSSLEQFKKTQHGRFRNWLRKVAESRIMDYYRDQKKIPWPDERIENQIYDPNFQLSTEEDNTEKALILNGILQDIQLYFTSVQIEAFQMMQQNYLTSREIGEQLGLSADNVRQISHRIKTFILENYGDLLN